MPNILAAFITLFEWVSAMHAWEEARIKIKGGCGGHISCKKNTGK